MVGIVFSFLNFGSEVETIPKPIPIPIPIPQKKPSPSPSPSPSPGVVVRTMAKVAKVEGGIMEMDWTYQRFIMKLK